MTQSDLNQAVADVTGESVTEIKHLGFSLADPLAVGHDPEPYYLRYVDWDQVDTERPRLFPR
jgi:hypothetical protein